MISLLESTKPPTCAQMAEACEEVGHLQLKIVQEAERRAAAQGVEGKLHPGILKVRKTATLLMAAAQTLRQRGVTVLN